MTKPELEKQITVLENQNNELSSRVSDLAGEIWDLEIERNALESELFEIRGYVPPFPDERYFKHPSAYIAEFNRIRHLKEVPACQ